LDVATVVAVHADPGRLIGLVRERGAPVLASAGLGEAGRGAYDRLLSAACEQVVRTLRAAPSFTAEAQVRLLGDVQEIGRAVNALPARLDQDGDAAHRDFTARYAEYVVRSIGTMEGFGLTRGRAPAQHRLEDAYVQQAVARAAPDDEDDAELTGAGTGVLNAFADARRALVRAGAGAGKTTLLRWLALQAAHGGLVEDGEPGGGVPFLVPPRQVPPAKPPRPPPPPPP